MQLDAELQAFSQYGLSIDNMIYNYTSEKNFSNYLEALKLGVTIEFFPEFSSSTCLSYAAVFAYNYILIPCNLTTGTPRPLCSTDCYIFRYYCDNLYTIFDEYADLLNIPFVDDCDNTFHHLNEQFNFPNSSQDFKDDCFDFSGTTNSITVCIAEAYSYS